MECNKDEAVRAKQIAENKMQIGDFTGARKFAQKAQQLFPELDNISQLLTVCDVHCSAQIKVHGTEMDWYGILQIEQFADEVTIKKQYRKLALVLHPDKNKFAGAEAAFKLIGEANRVLSDQTKRPIYDLKYRNSARTAVPKPPQHHSHINSHVKKQNGAAKIFPKAPHSRFAGSHPYQHPNAPHSQFTGSHPYQQAQQPTFWTCCSSCNIRYQYYREFVNKELRCQSCQQSFIAYDLGIKGMPPGSPWNSFPNHKGVPNQGPSKVASQSNGGKPSGTGFPNRFMGLDPLSKAGSTTELCGSSKTKLKDRNVDVGGGKEGVGIPEPDTANVKESGTSRSLSRKRGRKSLEDSSESYESGNSNNSEENVVIQDANGNFSGQKSGLDGCNHSRRSLRQKQHVSYKENLSDEDDLASPPKRSRGNKLSGAREDEMKEAAVDGGVFKNDNSAGSAAAVDEREKEFKQKAAAALEESMPNKKSETRKCEAEGKKAAVSNQDDGKSEVDDDSKSKSNVAPNAELLEYPDPDFSDFEKDKSESCFAANQLWAIYDTTDGMPRFYAWVKSVLSPGFKLRITWLEANPDSQGEQDWCDEELPVACGKYITGHTEETEDRLMFSHKMNYMKPGRRGLYLIYPRKGETWALFRNWDIKWSSDPKKHKPPYQFDFVEVLSDFIVDVGIEVAYLGKVKGFISVFQKTKQLGIISFRIPPNELYIFSHRIPSCRMTGKERVGVPIGSYELDPASLPTNLDELAHHDDVKIESECLDSEVNGLCPKSPENKVELAMGSGTICKTKKHCRSDPERETSILGRSPRELNGTSKNNTLVHASQSTNEENGSKDISHGNLTQPKGKATSSQADESFSTPKKQKKNDLATDALKLRRSPRELSKKNSEVNAGQCTTQEGIDKHSDANKDENRGSFTHSKGSASLSQSDDKMHLRARERSSTNITKGPSMPTPMSSGHRISEAECYDFKREKSEDKFQLDQIWALYSDKDGMPKNYALVKNIESTLDFRLHVVLLEACAPSNDMMRPVCCGTFKIKNRKMKVFLPSSFSHRSKAEPFGKNRYEIYPRKGEVWAVYKNWPESACSYLDDGKCDIVEVLEGNCRITKVVVLTQVSGSKSLFKAPRSLRSTTGVLEIPRIEFGRFSHQIPAVQHAEGKDNLLRGCWDLDPSALPGIMICVV